MIAASAAAPLSTRSAVASTIATTTLTASAQERRENLAPVIAQTDRITGVYVCTLPFRSAGLRIEIEQIGRKTIVHNYGHGGSG
jgi:hypothetical protein